MKTFATAALTLTVLTTLAVAQTAQPWPREFPPRPLAPRPVTFPPFEIKTWPTG